MRLGLAARCGLLVAVAGVAFSVTWAFDGEGRRAGAWGRGRAQYPAGRLVLWVAPVAGSVALLLALRSPEPLGLNEGVAGVVVGLGWTLAAILTRPVPDATLLAGAVASVASSGVATLAQERRRAPVGVLRGGPTALDWLVGAGVLAAVFGIVYRLLGGKP